MISTRLLSRVWVSSSCSLLWTRSASSRRRGQPRVPLMWPPEFAEPVSHQRELAELRKSDEYERLKLFSVRAADNNANCSLFRDPLIDKFANMIMQESFREVADRNMRNCFRRIKSIQLAKVHKALEAGKTVKTSADKSYVDDEQKAILGDEESEEDERSVFVDTSPISIVHRAIENARPLLRLKEVQVGSVMYSVPIAISYERSQFEAMRWMIHHCRERTEREISFADFLAELLVDTAHKMGHMVAKRNEHHEKCEQNRAYINLLKIRAKAIVRKDKDKGGRKK